MKLEDLGEFGLIEHIRRTFTKTSAKAPIGIGDDAAALFLSPSATVLATTDMLIEGVHFDLATTDVVSLGWKAAAANLSDIAAMGGAPRFCLIGLGLPPRLSVEAVDGFYRGFHRMIRKYGALLAGGDTCRSDRGLIISVTVLGEAKRRQIITRSGARPGDRVYVTGTLGDSAAGLELLQGTSDKRRGKRRATADERKLIERHLRPVPRVAWGRKLAGSGCVSAMIDVSDGLSSDLGHICDESRMGAEVHADRIPLSGALASAKGLKRPALDYALSGGEDYELLFTVPARKVGVLRRLRVPAAEIGRITRDRTVALVGADGMRRPLAASGYEHFGKRHSAKGAAR
jgi:thiamine-monophosphate kinase